MTDHERSSEKQNDLQPASPAEPFHLPPKPDWTEAEKWVWERVCQEETADFNDHEGELDPEKPDGWSEKRLIRPAFLETILLHDPFRSALGPKGVRISGAWIKEPIDLENARLGHEWRLEKSRLEAEVTLLRLEGTEEISFVGSVFTGPVDFSFANLHGGLSLISTRCKNMLNMNSLAVGGHLFMGSGAEFMEVDLCSAKVGGQLDLTASKCIGRLNMNSLAVGSHLFMRGGAEFAEVDLGSARVEGQVDLTAAKFTGNLNMNGLAIGGSLFMRGGAELMEVDLGSAQVGGQLDMTAVLCKGKLNMNGLSVGSSLFMREGAELMEVDLGSARVNGQLDMTAAKVQGKLNMNSLVVEGSLLMRRGAEFAEVELISAKVGGQLSLIAAKCKGKLNMNSLAVGSHLFMGGGAEFAEVDLISAKVQGQLDLTAAQCKGKLNMNGLAVGSYLFMGGGAEFGEVELGGARVDGPLDMAAAKVKGHLSMDGLAVGNLFMGNGAEFSEVSLGSAKVRGLLDMTAAKFTGSLNMNGLLVEGNLFMRNGAEFSDVNLGSAKVDGQLDMTALQCKGELNMDSLVVGSHLFIRSGAVFDRSVSISFGNIGGNFDISGARVPLLDLTGVQVQGELRIDLGPVVVGGSSDRSRLILRNAKVGAVQDGGENAWPEGKNSIDLSGFRYTRLGGQDVGGTVGGIESRKKGWFIEWLEKDGTFSPQPYHQLAEVMREMGHTEEATEILYAGKERERRNAKGLNWLGLSLLKYLIGYGYGYRYFYSLIWVVLITFIGTWVFSTTEMGHSLGWGRKSAFSLDMLLPFIELDSKHSEMASALNDWQRYYFFGHKVFGFILGSFVVAGLSGITKR